MGKACSIILSGSSAGTTGALAFTVYSASNAAVRNLPRTLAEDLKGTGVRLNVLSPGATATELAKAALAVSPIFRSMRVVSSIRDFAVMRVCPSPPIGCTSADESGSQSVRLINQSRATIAGNQRRRMSCRGCSDEGVACGTAGHGMFR